MHVTICEVFVCCCLSASSSASVHPQQWQYLCSYHLVGAPELAKGASHSLSYGDGVCHVRCQPHQHLRVQTDLEWLMPRIYCFCTLQYGAGICVHPISRVVTAVPAVTYLSQKRGSRRSTTNTFKDHLLSTTNTFNDHLVRARMTQSQTIFILRGDSQSKSALIS